MLGVGSPILWAPPGVSEALYFNALRGVSGGGLQSAVRLSSCSSSPVNGQGNGSSSASSSDVSVCQGSRRFLLAEASVDPNGLPSGTAV